MDRKSIFNLIFQLIAILFVTTGSVYYQTKTISETSLERHRNQTTFLFPDMGCSVIFATNDEVAFGGNNEDYTNPFTMAWFLPPANGKFGRVYFG